MYLKLIIITILIIIIINFLFNNANNEHLKINLVKNDKLKFENQVKEYKNNDSVRKFNDIQVLNKFMINNVELKDIILNIRYPIGCYYIQYPENNINIHDDDDIEIGDLDTMLPYAKSPEKLFGGKWEEKFKGDSVFFRTGGVLSDDSRLNGIQIYAMKNLNGWTSYAQTNISNPGYGAQGVLEDVEITEGSIKTDGIPEDVKNQALVGFIAYLTWGLSGKLSADLYKSRKSAKYVKADLNNQQFAKPGDTVDSKINVYVKHRATEIGHQNIMDPSLQTSVSSYELRVRNRIMKVWKRIG
jgi:hypothetical protein